LTNALIAALICSARFGQRSTTNAKSGSLELGVPDSVPRFSENAVFDTASGGCSKQCLIKISDKDGAIASDTSNHVFTIFECDASLTADLSGDCKVDFTDFALFSDQWLACGNPHDPNWCP
jgi:hypothetical protein